MVNRGGGQQGGGIGSSRIRFPEKQDHFDNSANQSDDIDSQGCNGDSVKEQNQVISTEYEVSSDQSEDE